jgi:ParB family transcriptional regulator, chromosome partitioning protein
VKVEIIDIDKLIPYARNPRKNDAAITKVSASIKEFGFKQPIVVDSDMVIVAGHTRYEASKKLGLEQVPVVIADDLTEAQIKAYRIADNKTNEYAEWDYDLLKLEFDDLKMLNFELTKTSFDINEANTFVANGTDIVEMPILKNGEKSQFQQMTFILHDEQVEKIKSACAIAKKIFAFDDLNTNQNGNAISKICENFLIQNDKS